MISGVKITLPSVGVFILVYTASMRPESQALSALTDIHSL